MRLEIVSAANAKQRKCSVSRHSCYLGYKLALLLWMLLLLQQTTNLLLAAQQDVLGRYFASRLSEVACTFALVLLLSPLLLCLCRWCHAFWMHTTKGLQLKRRCTTLCAPE